MSQQATAVAQPQKVNAPTATNKQSERLLRRKCACGGSAGLTGACKECDENRLRVQRRAVTPALPSCPTHVVNDVLEEEGQDLDESTRVFMESQLGHDFRRVRIHTNARAAESARAVNALAYTVGTDIVFASGQYQPHTNSGRHLIVHELAHTLQQRDQPRGAQTKLEIGEEGDELEREADRLADRVMRSAFSGATPPAQPPQLPTSSVGPLVQRAAADEASVQPERETNDSPAPQNLGLIVEDDAAALGPGQMRKSQFLDDLRAASCAAADAELKRVGRSTEACPYIARAFERYRTFTSQKLERGLRRYAPEAAKATSAQQYIDAVSARVGRAVGVWATTGEITDVPDELKGEFGVMGFFGGLGGVFASLGSVVGGVFGGIGKALGGLFFKARDGGARDDVDAGEVQAQLGAGQTLDPTVKSRMEGAFGHDFSRVRVHANAGAAALTSNLNARAFTVGSDIGFADGQYKPGTLVGDALIAHELAHVVQQGDSVSSDAPPMKKESTANSDVLEEDADESAVSAVASIWGGVKHGLTKISRKAMPRLKSGLQLQRCSPPDYEVNGLPSDTAQITDSIFFNRRSTDIEKSEQKKIDDLKSPEDGKLRLYSFISEDENIPPKYGSELVRERYEKVDEALREGPNEHTGEQIKGDDKKPDTAYDTQSSKGNLNYRSMRKVKVLDATETSSGVKDCSAQGLDAGEQDCSDETKFTSAQEGVEVLLQKPVEAIQNTDAISEDGKTRLDRHFHTSNDENRKMAASVVLANLNKVKTHIQEQMKPPGTKGKTEKDRKPGHVCANECDPSCGEPTIAYNSKRDDEAVLTLCDTGTGSAFMNQESVDRRALTLIHEGLHGITISVPAKKGKKPPEMGAEDVAYSGQGALAFIDTETALVNNDSYVLFVADFNDLLKGKVKSGGPPEREALAFVEGWLVFADQDMRSLYRDMNQSRDAGKWTNPYSMETMRLIAPIFDMTPPEKGQLPTAEDQAKVAAIRDRLARLWSVPRSSVPIKKSPNESTHWEEGPKGPLTLGKDFFDFPEKDPQRKQKQVDLVLRTLLKAAPDITLVDEFVQMLDEIRKHRGRLALK